jgi:hypothetical protein
MVMAWLHYREFKSYLPLHLVDRMFVALSKLGWLLEVRMTRTINQLDHSRTSCFPTAGFAGIHATNPYQTSLTTNTNEAVSTHSAPAENS